MFLQTEYYNAIFIFRDEQGIKIPDDDDGGFDEPYQPTRPTRKKDYKPNFPSIASQFDHSGFGGYDKPSVSYPDKNSYQKPVYEQIQPPAQIQPPSPENSIYTKPAYVQPKPPTVSQRPYGQDYTQHIPPSAPNKRPGGDRRVSNRPQKPKLPLTIGLDVYPVLGGSRGKGSSVFHHGSSRESGSLDENLHEVLLKLNLFSRKPQKRGGNRRGEENDTGTSISLGPFSYNANG